MRKTLIAILLALALVVIPVGGALAATSADVTVTATPTYISITDSPNTWTLNGITGNGKIRPNTAYYSNPLGDTTAPSATVVDAECRFTVTNAAGSTVSVDLTVTCSDFSGGGANMANSDTGSNGTTSYGAYCWYSGMTYTSKVVVKTSGSSKMYSAGLAAGSSLKWGAEIKTQTDDFTSGTSSTATMTITATEH